MSINSIPLGLVVLGTIMLTLAGSGLSGRSMLRTTNTNGNYSKWSNRSAIPYMIDSAFTAAENAMIKQAILAVQTALPPSCINFVETPSTNNIFKIKFTPLDALGKAQVYCYSYPGKVLNDEKYATNRGQVVSLARGTTGCLQSYCQIQRYIASVLGKRNEHQRGDRDSYITMAGTLAVPGAFTKYTVSEAYWGIYPYDYCSITHNQPNEFAAAGIPAFSLPATAPVKTIPPPCALSLTDCKLISMLYGCDSSQCKQPSCVNQIGQATSGTTVPPPTTTPGPPCLDFCATTTNIDEGAWLLDGRQVLFSGTCYSVVNAGTNKITPGVAAAKQIAGLFPTTSTGAVITGPIDSAWRSDANTLHILTNGVQYKCTTTTCTPETPAKPKTEGVFEVVDTTGAYTVYTIDATGANYIDDSDASSTVVSNVFNSCESQLPPTCTNPLKTITAGWATGPDTVSVIGKDASGVQKLSLLQNIPVANFLTAGGETQPYC